VKFGFRGSQKLTFTLLHTVEYFLPVGVRAKACFITQNTLILQARVRNRCWGWNRAHTPFLTKSSDKSWQVQIPIIQYFLANYSKMHSRVSHTGSDVALNPLTSTYFDKG
jgi:hypothetical protein